MGSRDIRVGTIVDIQHSCLGAFKKHLFASSDFFVEQSNRIADMRAKTIRIALIFLEQSIIIERLMVIKQFEFLILDCQIFPQTFSKLLFIHEITDTDTDTVIFILVAGTNTALRRTDLVLAARLITDTVHDTMIRHDDMCPVGKTDTAYINALGRHRIHFLEHDLRIYYNAVRHDTGRTFIKDSRWQKTKLEFLIMNGYRMTGIAAALKAYHRIRFFC